MISVFISRYCYGICKFYGSPTGSGSKMLSNVFSSPSSVASQLRTEDALFYSVMMRERLREKRRVPMNEIAGRRLALRSLCRFFTNNRACESFVLHRASTVGINARLLLEILTIDQELSRGNRKEYNEEEPQYISIYN